MVWCSHTWTTTRTYVKQLMYNAYFIYLFIFFIKIFHPYPICFRAYMYHYLLVAFMEFYITLRCNVNGFFDVPNSSPPRLKCEHWQLPSLEKQETWSQRNNTFNYPPGPLKESVWSPRNLHRATDEERNWPLDGPHRAQFMGKCGQDTDLSWIAI